MILSNKLVKVLSFKFDSFNDCVFIWLLKMFHNLYLVLYCKFLVTSCLLGSVFVCFFFGVCLN